MASRLNLLPVALLLAAGCGKAESPAELRWADFDGGRAYKHVEDLVALGPRPTGSEALVRAADYIAAQLKASGLELREQVFEAATPRGPIKFRNIIGMTRRSAAGGVIVIGSHYDTKWMPGIRMVGANDGGSSVGVLLEMARVAVNQPNVWFVFFDGEEAMAEYGAEDGLWGSRYFVRDLNSDAKTAVERVKAMILLDMIGDARLNVGLPANSTGRLVQEVFEAARATGNRDVFGVDPREILDDHVPFLDAGIPAVDLIDFEYGSAPGLNDYWHTERDTLDKISPGSLQAAGRTVLKVVESLQKQAKAN